MAKEYIEREAFDRKLQELVKWHNKNCESEQSSGVFEALHELRLFPVADVEEVVHGEWVRHYYDSGEPIDDKWYCSECHMCNDHRRTWYCPNCGAKMDGERKEV